MGDSDNEVETINLGLLVKQRGGIKSRFTYFSNLYKKNEIKNIGELKSTLSRISELYKKFDSVQSIIEENSEDENIYDERFKFEKLFGELEAALLNDVHTLEVESEIEFKARSQELSDDDKSKSSKPSLSIKLPEIKLPQFSGAVTDWLKFRNLYQEFIHKKSIDEITKFYYLTGAVRDGKAYRLIESIPLSSENYNEAWRAICEHYDNNVEIQRNHMKLIYDIFSPIPNSSESLQKFIDELIKNRTALSLLKINVESWDLFFFHHICEKLDSQSKVFLIENTTANRLPEFANVIKVLKERVRILESIGSLKNTNSSTMFSKNKKTNRSNYSSSPGKSYGISNVSRSENTSKIECYYCKQHHLLYNCPKFSDAKMTALERLEFVKSNKLCTNCLSARHRVFECNSRPCSLCSLKHNILLHFNRVQKVVPKEESETNPVNNYKPLNIAEISHHNLSYNSKLHELKPSLHHNNNLVKEDGVIHKTSCASKIVSHHSQNLLATAVVYAISSDHRQVPCRVLLDSGSDSNFITKSLYNLLKIRSRTVNMSINGIGGKSNSVKFETEVEIKSRNSNFKKSIKCLVLPKITENLPSKPINITSIQDVSKFELADPAFYMPNKIDMLIGAEIFFEVLLSEKVIVKELPTLQNTVFGYIISGKVNENSNQNSNAYTVSREINTVSNDDISSQLQKFWSLEEVNVKHNYSQQEMEVEQHYSKYVSRKTSGRYSVKMPLNIKIFELGNSYQSTLRKYLWLEARLNKNPELKQQYADFIKEYKNLGHMEIVTQPSKVASSVGKAYYLPHHHVIRENSTTTRLRVVFNASSKTDSNISLNDAMFPGPIIQQELIKILLRFRKHKVALTSDITKMYRQIQIEDDQRDLLRIFWRDSCDEKIECYRLSTVTYGTTSAPYLATRTLLQLACDEEADYPVESQIVKSDFYVDDLLTGAPSIEKANQIKKGITSLLSKGGFELQKWASNREEVVPTSNEDTQSSKAITILGLNWNTSEDTFYFEFNHIKVQPKLTKRSVLSEIAQLFDPMGICAPVIFMAKHFMQLLWTHAELSWDDTLPSNLENHWKCFRDQIKELKVTIPRCVVLPDSENVELHGYSDASDKGYGAVIYIRTVDKHKNCSIRLLCAKSRVAPLSKLTTPRLELCAALLLATLIDTIIKAMDLCVNRVVLWSDSQVTLQRINSDPSRFKQFVANRITQILELTKKDQWMFVPSEYNPADIISRGIMPNKLLSSSIWWNGPSYLKLDSVYWPNQNWKNQTEIDVESKKDSINVYFTMNKENWDVFSRFSDYNRLVGAIAICLRLFNWFHAKSEIRNYGKATPEELERSETRIIQNSQSTSFPDELRCLRINKPVLKSSKIYALNPFVDKCGIIRLGGRLENANLSYNVQHPIVLSKSHNMTKLIVKSEHERLLHAGVQALLFSLRQRFWIVGGRSLCKQIIFKCVTCFKAKPELTNQLMGSLPALRVNKPPKIFYAVGVDFAGPFLLKTKLRKQIVTKFYIAIFICFSTKAVHIELVEDLTTDSFIAALIRFVSRRGFCTHIYSDNATNFIGAKSELKELQDVFFNETSRNKIINYCSNHRIQWHTIPPRSPHFGGLWEASIKKAKFHMRRIIGKATFTHDEYHTLFCQIEALLNSRPLVPMSDDPNDLNYLSPAHFIIGDVLTALPNASLEHLNFNKLKRFQRVQFIQQQFWKCWSGDYLLSLQQRYKWRTKSNNVKEGQLVLLREDNIPPQMWVLGRINEVFYGTDGLVRVVKVKTRESEFKRAIQKISVLPLYDDDDQILNN